MSQALRLLDLHGNATKGQKSPDGKEDQNVFEIKQGVAITFGIQQGGRQDAAISHADLWGSREEKYRWLVGKTASEVRWRRLVPASPYFFFVPRNDSLREEYDSYLPLEKIVRDRASGMITARDGLTVQFTRSEIEQTVRKLASLSEKQAREFFSLGRDARDWTVAGAQADIKAHGFGRRYFRDVLYRPFDVRHTYYTGTSRGFIGQPQKRIFSNFEIENNWALCVSRFNRQKSLGYFFVTLRLTDFHLLDTVADSMTVFPVWIKQDSVRQASGLIDVDDSLGGPDLRVWAHEGRR